MCTAQAQGPWLAYIRPVPCPMTSRDAYRYSGMPSDTAKAVQCPVDKEEQMHKR
jgi:hypothetical protein